MIRFLESLQFVLFVFFTAAYAYQMVYLAVGLLGRGRKGREDAPPHRYAVMIAARNEQNVIEGLIVSLKKQRYPEELVDIFVIADNCTDDTATVARAAGAFVYERFNKTQVGKGYAMDFLIQRIFQNHGRDTYDGFFVFDADNIVDQDFVTEMNKMFDGSDYAAITCYRNSKNFCDNWITAGYSLWFVREGRFLNQPRAQLGINCAVSGTGFLISGDVLREKNGWPYHLLTEDIEFSVSCAVERRKIGYCGTAVVYDEQPTRFKQSWDQRMRWSKGFYQVDAKYMGSLLRGTLRGGRRGFSCYDMLMTVAPCNLITVAAILVGLVVGVTCFTQPIYVMYRVLRLLMHITVMTVMGLWCSLFCFGAISMLCEWKKIDGPVHKKLLSVFTFPFFMLTYVPISIVALMQKVEWKPIQHGVPLKHREE